MRDDIPYINLHEALEFSEKQIATNGKIIIYIVNLAIVDKQICKTINITAVINIEKNNI